MGFLKGIGLTFISIILFLSILLLGIGVTVNLTALNPGFVNRQIEKLDIAGLINEKISEDPSANDLPQAVRTFLDADLPTYSEEIKTAAEEANSRLYDYILGRTDTLDLNVVFGETILDPQLIYSLADRINWPSLADELVRKEIAKSGGVNPTFSYLLDYIDDAAVKLDPWFKSTLRQVVPPVRDYLLGQTQTLNVSISLEEPAAALYTTLLDAFNRFPPPELAGLSAAQKQAAFNSFFFFELIPSLPAVIDIDSSLFSGEPQDLNQGFADLKTGLDRTKSYVNDYWLAFYGLILLIALLMGFAFLILKRFSGWMLFIGVTLLVFGLSGFASAMVANSIITGIDFGSVPAAIQLWLPGVIQDALKPFIYFSIGAGILGIVAIVISILTRRRPGPTQRPTPTQ